MTPCIRRDFVVLKKDKGNLVKLRLLSVSSIVLVRKGPLLQGLTSTKGGKQ